MTPLPDRSVLLRLALVVTIALVGVACGDPDPAAAPVPDATTTTAPPSTTSTMPPTTAPLTTSAPEPPSTTTAPPEPVDPVLRRGASGADVAALQQRLADLGYWLPAVDGDYGSGTAQAVMAFQKAQGLARDGIAGPGTLDALKDAGPPTPRHPDRNGFEIDLERQLLLYVRDGRVAHAFNTSTGRAGWRTNPGEFRVDREVDGLRQAPLGDLWRPKYFDGGIAMHGASDIPGQPASHGCARLHNAAIDFIWARDLAPIGTPVTVY